MWANGIAAHVLITTLLTFPQSLCTKRFATTPGRTYQLSFNIPQKTASAFAVWALPLQDMTRFREAGFWVLVRYVVRPLWNCITHYLSLFILHRQRG